MDHNRPDYLSFPQHVRSKLSKTRTKGDDDRAAQLVAYFVRELATQKGTATRSSEGDNTLASGAQDGAGGPEL